MAKILDFPAKITDPHWTMVLTDISRSRNRASRVKYWLTHFRKQEMAMNDLVLTSEWCKVRNKIRHLERLTRENR